MTGDQRGLDHPRRQGSHGPPLRPAAFSSRPGTSPGAPDKRGPERPRGKSFDREEIRLFGGRRTNRTTISVQLHSATAAFSGFAWTRLPKPAGPGAASCHAEAGYVWQEAFFVLARRMVTPAGKTG